MSQFRSYQSGVWEGYYKPSIDKIPLALSLVFRNGRITGNGIDKTAGSYKVEGNYVEKAPYSVSFKLIFSGNQEKNLNCEGFREASGGIFGSVTGAASGGFQIAPAKEGGELAKKLQEEGQKLMTQTLKSMGFPDYLIETALHNSNGNLESAVEFCTRQMEPTYSGFSTSPNDDDVDKEALQQLLTFGFDEKTSRQALKQAKNNVDHAANM